MATLLKQSTAETIEFGPFLDKTDGDTEETALSLVTADILISKNHAALTAKNDATNPTGGTNGHYQVTLDATDTGTLGRLRVYCHKTGTLAVWEDFEVVPANVYDSWVAGTDTLNADVTQWLGTAAATPSVAGVPEVDVTHVAGATTNVAALATNVDAILTDTADMQPKLGTPVADVSADVAAIKAETALVVADTNELQTDDVPGLIAALNDLSAAQVNTEVDNALNTAIPGVPTADSINQRIRSMDLLTEAAGAGDLAAILTDTANMQPKLGSPAADLAADIAAVKAETTSLDGTKIPDTLSLANINAEVDTALNTAIPGVPTANSINERVKAIDDLTQAAGGGDLAAILTDTADMQPKLGAPVGASISADIATVDTVVDGIQTDLDNGTDGLGALKALIDALNDMSLTELRTALGTNGSDVIPELAQGIPATTPSLADAVMLLYMMNRNKLDVTATLMEVHNNAGTVITKKTLSDDGTTYSEALMASGP